MEKDERKRVKLPETVHTRAGLVREYTGLIADCVSLAQGEEDDVSKDYLEHVARRLSERLQELLSKKKDE